MALFWDFFPANPQSGHERASAATESRERPSGHLRSARLWPHTDLKAPLRFLVEKYWSPEDFSFLDGFSGQVGQGKSPR